MHYELKDELLDSEFSASQRFIELVLFSRRIEYFQLLVRDYGNYTSFMEKAMAENSSRDCDHINFESGYPDRFRSATFVNLFSLLEDQYYEFCEAVRKTYKTPLRLNAVKEAGLQKVRIYLGKICNFDALTDKEWDNLLTYQMIRHLKEHNQCVKEKYRDQARLIPGVKLLPDGYILLQEDFLYGFFEFTAAHLPNLFTADL